jgi:dethiobiotin synthetase
MHHVADTLKKLHNEDADFLLVEGAGGWRLPTFIPLLSNGIGESKSAEVNGTKKVKFLSDFVVQAKLPVIIVVGMKLGCLNHAVLTFEQIKRDNCDIVGWFANQVDPSMSSYSENLASLHALLDAPFLGEVKYKQQSIDFAGNALKHILG